jgi:hypothetical protein
MQEPGNPVAARGTAPDPLLSFYYYYYHHYDKHTPLGWGSPLRAWLLNRSFLFTSEGVDRSPTDKVSTPQVRLLQGGLGSPLRAMLLFSFLPARGSPSPKLLVRCYQWPAPPLPAQPRQPSARGSPSPEKNHKESVKGVSSGSGKTSASAKGGLRIPFTPTEYLSALLPRGSS